MTSLAISPSGVTLNALSALRRALNEDDSFSPNAVDRILAWVADHGTLEGSPYIYPEELDRFTDVLVDALPAADWDDPLWSMDDGHYVPNSVIPTETIVCQFFMLEEPALPPLCGGCDDLTPEYIPTEADWREYHEMMDEIDRNDRYFARFNDERDDSSEVAI